MKSTCLIVSAISFLSVSLAHAEQQPLGSLDPVELIQKAMTDDANSVWGLRVFNMRAMGNHRAALEAGQWCAANDDACVVFARLGSEAEEATASIIPLNERIIGHLKSQPRNKETDAQIKVLEAQLKTLKNLGTPFNDMLAKMKAAKQR